MLRRALLACAVVALALAVAPCAWSGEVLDRVRADHVVRCGAPARPGLVTEEGGSGLLVDLCRAVAAAVLGPDAPVRFAIYDSDRDFDAVRTGADDIFFLDASDIVAQHLAGKVLPGPAVYVETTAVIVKGTAPARTLADLDGQPICFLQGENGQRNLEAWFAARHLSFVRMAYQEVVEMWDAFDAGACRGLAGETTTLAAARRGGDGRPTGGRLLPDTLAAFPILATTGTQDAQWAAIVAWTMHTLLAADAATTPWSAGGADALPLGAPIFGLPAAWQRTVLASVGSYADIYRRNLGDGSPLKLPPGPNSPWPGGAMLPPHAE